MSDCCSKKDGFVNGVKAPRKVCLAYSGGLDTSIMIDWLKETYGCEVVAYAADVGQGAVETEPLIAKAKATGAVKCIVEDLRKLRGPVAKAAVGATA